MSRLVLGIPFSEAVYEMNITMNPHYNFNAPENRAVIESVNAYDKAWVEGDIEAIKEAERVALKGADGYEIGVNVPSPWGDNEVLEAHIGEFGKDEDIVKKKIKVKPGFMLSLQRHRGREELWEVTSGTLTVISDGKVHTVKAGESIQLPKGNVHCMINRDSEPVTVIETQTGTCREADNVRLVDFNDRETVPLLTKPEAESAILYAEIHAEIKAKFGADSEPKTEFTTDEYRQTVAQLKPAA